LGNVANTMRNAAVAVASAVSPITLKIGNHGSAMISMLRCRNVSYADPTRIAVAASAMNTAVRDLDTVSSHMPSTKSGSAPRMGQTRPWSAFASMKPRWTTM